MNNEFYNKILQAINQQDLEEFKQLMNQDNSILNHPELILAKCASLKNIGFIQYILKHCEVEKISAINKQNMLIYVIKKSTVERLDYLIEQGFSIEKDAPMAPLVACQYKKMDILMYLVENQIDVNYIDEKNRFAIKEACIQNNEEMLSLLLKGGANIALSYYATIYYCIENNNLNLLELILKDQKIDWAYHNYEFIKQAIKSDTSAILDLFCQYGAINHCASRSILLKAVLKEDMFYTLLSHQVYLGGINIESPNIAKMINDWNFHQQLTENLEEKTIQPQRKI